MQPTIYRYLVRHSLKGQIVLLSLTLVSFPFLYASLDLPKTIINQAIGGTVFPKVVLDVEFSQLGYLLALCALFLTLVLINGAFKYAINVYKGHLAERTLRRLRYELFSRVLRFPLPHFRRLSQGELISMITAEVEPLGGFIGDAFELPAFQGGTLLTILLFMFVQDPVLGLAAVALYPLQIYLIPKLQRRVNELGMQRIRAVRKLSQRVGETVAGIEAIHAHDTSEYERAEFARRLGRIYDIRYEIYKNKFLIKFLNNFLAQVTPFFFFSIGGYLVIRGELTLGALVAVLAAYKDLSAPWKELLGFYQEKEDARIKYEQLAAQFQPAGMLAAELQRPVAEPPGPLAGLVLVNNAILDEEGGIRVLDGVNLAFDMAEHVAITGPSGAGRAALARLIARLLAPTGGSVTIAGRSPGALPEALTGRRMAFVDQAAHLFSGTIEDNLLYGLRHHPAREPRRDAAAERRRQAYVAEALASGNTPADPEADWIDYAQAGVDGPETLGERIHEVLRAVAFEDEVLGLGLKRRLDPAARPELAGKVLEARRLLGARFAAPAFADLVEPFDRRRYNASMTVAENLLFGYPIGPEFDLDRLGDNAYVLAVLHETGLVDSFVRTGLRLAALMVDLFRDLPPGHEYFERYSFVSFEDWPQVQQTLARAETAGVSGLGADDRRMLVSLAFKLIAGRHRLGLLDLDMQERILAARAHFARHLPASLQGAIAFLDAETYNAAAVIQDNILFGKPVYGRPQASQQIGALIGEVIDALGLRRDIVALGLATAVGIGGGRLTLAQRQKVALARALLKRPDLLIVDDATNALDPASQSAVLRNVLAAMKGRGVLWVLNRAELARHFERVVVMEGGRIVEQGRFDQLCRPGTRLHKALPGE